MSPPSDPHAALRRSRNRVLVLLALNDLGDAYLAHLSRETGVTPQHVRSALLGGTGYLQASSLVALGLAVAERRRDLRVFRITPKGRKVAREWLERNVEAPGALAWPGLRWGLLPHVH